MVQENLKYVNKKIEESCKKAKRSERQVTLIAVSKTKPIDLIMEAYDAGIREFGENKVQELVDKFEKMPKDIHWHLIGHLQTNKVKYIIDKAFLIHGVDSMKLAQEISKEAKKHNLTANILVQINIGHEESKSGIDPSDTVSFVKEVATLPNLTIKGLMAIAPYVENPEDNRQYFEQMKKLSVDITQESVNNVSMDVLSMGMTGDYQVAIEEGATYVRVGTGIFGDRIYR